MKLKKIIQFLFFFILLPGCELSDNPNPKMYNITSDHIDLVWNHPKYYHKQGILSISYYNVYYKLLNDQFWIYLGSIDLYKGNTFRVNHSDVGSGKIAFSIRAVYENNTMSSFHSSLDHDAEPFWGWYINWNYNK